MMNIDRRPHKGIVHRSTRAAVRIHGNDGKNSYEVFASSLRLAKAKARAQGITFPRRVREDRQFMTLSKEGYETTRVSTRVARRHPEMIAWAQGKDWREASGFIPGNLINLRAEWDSAYR